MQQRHSLGQYPQALEQFQQALIITREIGDRSGEGTALNNIGAVYGSLGQYSQALEQYQQALVSNVNYFADWRQLYSGFGIENRRHSRTTTNTAVLQRWTKNGL